MHCALSLGEETEGADKEALPVEPDKRRKASAEERLDTVLDFENTTGEGSGTNTPSPQLFVGGIVYCWRGTTEGAWTACAEDGNSKWIWKGLFQISSTNMFCRQKLSVLEED